MLEVPAICLVLDRVFYAASSALNNVRIRILSKCVLTRSPWDMRSGRRISSVFVHLLDHGGMVNQPHRICLLLGVSIGIRSRIPYWSTRTTTSAARHYWPWTLASTPSPVLPHGAEKFVTFWYAP